MQFLHQMFNVSALGRRTQAGDANNQWRDQWNVATVCTTQWRSPALAGWLSWIVDVDRPSADGHPCPKQCNRLESSPGCLGATCQARWKWRSHAAGTSVCSSSSREPRLTANITVNMFSVAVYYLTSLQDASATPGPCSRTAHRHTLLGTYLTLFGVPFSRWLECVVQQQGEHIEHLM